MGSDRDFLFGVCVCVFAATHTPLCSHASVCLLAFGDVRVRKRVPQHVLLCRSDSPPPVFFVMSRGARCVFQRLDFVVV